MALKTLSLLLLISGIFSATAMSTAKPGHNLQARLYGEGMGQCWTALLELKSCTNEIVLFFLNGEAYLGLDCCREIRIITRECWPTMLTSLGFTSQEGDILRGYCDATVSPSAPNVELFIYKRFLQNDFKTSMVRATLTMRSQIWLYTGETSRVAMGGEYNAKASCTVSFSLLPTILMPSLSFGHQIRLRFLMRKKTNYTVLQVSDNNKGWSE